MKRLLFGICIAALFTVAVGADSMAREVKGVNFPESVSIGGKTCSLAGVGIRKKLIISVYLGALYLEKPAKTGENVIAAAQTKRILMHFLYSEVTADQIVEAWNEGFANNSPDAVAALKDKIARFNGFFTAPLKKGDTIAVTYIPGTGTEVSLNGSVKGVIDGEDFMKAVFAIWFGPKPPSKGLKKGMLGE